MAIATGKEAQCPICQLWLPLVVHPGEPTLPGTIRVIVDLEHPADKRHSGSYNDDACTAIIGSMRSIKSRR